MTERAILRAVASLSLLLSTGDGMAQGPCEGHWVPGDGFRGVIGAPAYQIPHVSAMLNWDPDGEGPRESVVVVAGHFFAAGDVLANRIAAWDSATETWSPLGAGISGGIFTGTAHAMAVLPNGDLIVGGEFAYAGDVFVNGIARWDGETWSALGNDRPGEVASVSALLVLPNGDLIAGGQFNSFGGVDAFGIARWDGTRWNRLGSGMGIGGWVSSLALLPNGDVVAGGDFSVAGGVPANSVARWNGVTWSPLGDGIVAPSYGRISDVVVLPNGDVIVGGLFTMAGDVNANNVARWDGTSWSPLGDGVDGQVLELELLPDGSVLAGGWFRHIARWDGAAWSALASGLNHDVFAIETLPNGDILVGGRFTRAGNAVTMYIARWDGANWLATNPGFDQRVVSSLLVMDDGDIVAGGGPFTSRNGERVSSIARWNGQSWSALGAGVSGGAANVYALATLPNGDLLAAGDFTVAGGMTAWNIARWDGASWFRVGPGFGILGSIWALVVLPNGDILAGGQNIRIGNMPQGTTTIARLSGSTWVPLGLFRFDDGDPAYVHAMVLMPNGDLVVGGGFDSVDGVPASSIARWNGTTWAPLGAGVDWLYGGFVDALTLLPGGDLVAAGFFDSAGDVAANNIARWDGSAWLPLGMGLTPGSVNALTVLGNGDLIAGGNFTVAGGAPAWCIARWDGADWSSVGGGISPVGVGINTEVRALVALSGNDFAAGGNFTVAGDHVAAGFARNSDVCPADFDCNGEVGLSDLSLLLSNFGCVSPPDCGQSDLDGDGDVGISDLALLLANFGTICP